MAPQESMQEPVQTIVIVPTLDAEVGFEGGGEEKDH
jgi:hypothetical protein